MSGAIVKVQAQPAFEFSTEQRQMIRESFLNGASEAEAGVLLELARLRRLNPITGQIHFVKRWNAQRRAEVWSAQVGIDGLRAIAERTGRYDGQDEPEFEYDARGGLKACKVKVYRKDWARPVVGVAHFTEYAQTKKEGGLTAMWASKPHIMLAKCAEALALRKGFPEDMAGLHADEEISADEREVNTPPANPGASTAALPAASTAALPAPSSEAMTGAVRVREKLAARRAQQQSTPAANTDDQGEEIVTPFMAFARLAQEFGMSPGQLAVRAQQLLGKTSGFSHADIATLRASLAAVPAK